jgi:3-hydroxyisobutyrate dehydrogenase-like beta-hydroxyacid dehydrogenase
MGAAGMGASMKLVGNALVAAQIQALGEAMVLASNAGLKPPEVLDVLAVTDFRSPIFQGVGHSLLEGDFRPNFALKHMLKDANLIAAFAEDLRSPMPTAAVTREMVKAAVNQGWGEENASAMIKALESMAGTEVRTAGSHREPATGRP